jgi:UDP-GlcNAc:undecaprenyl-phosphate GlcNAc-1-phosphate transferase
VKDYLLTLLVAAAVTYVLTPLVRRFAAMIGAIKVEIRERDVHTAPVPLIGGLAMYAGLVAALLVANQIPQLHDAIANTGMVTGLLAAGGLLVIIGIIDDRWGMNALTKAAGQVAAGGIVVATGTQLSWLPLPGGSGRIFVPTPDQQTLLTILIVVATINAVNFIDGLDGLAAGIVAIAAMSFFAYYYSLTKLAGISSLAAPALASAVLIGICLGFLPHNFAPAKIFMGDTGSMLLGLVLAYAPISSINSLDPAQLTDSINRYPVIMPLLLPAVLLVIPYGDMLLAVVRRTTAGQSPFAADRKHLHHRLLDIGHSQRASVLIMYLWAAAFSGTVVWLSITKTELPRAHNHHGEPVMVFLLITVVAVAVLVLLSMPWRHWGERARAGRSPAAASLTGQAPRVAEGATARQPARAGVSDLVATGAPAAWTWRAGALRATADLAPGGDRAGDAVRSDDAQPTVTAADDAGAREEAPPRPAGSGADGRTSPAWHARSLKGDIGGPSSGADASGGLRAGGEWPPDGAAGEDRLRGGNGWPAAGAAAGNGLPDAERWQGGDGSGNGLGGAEQLPGGDAGPDNGRYEADRSSGREGSGNGLYEAEGWPGSADNGWFRHGGQPPGPERAGNGLRAGADQDDYQDHAPDELADGGHGRSVVGTVPPASDWSWFGSSASNDPGSRDR